ncbi:MAG TPA: hypothetical protein ENI62_05925 [Gammaproteobacteria bacterium]|nr:hypothetical protein [Gammaproteobacteria bacterium]
MLITQPTSFPDNAERDANIVTQRPSKKTVAASVMLTLLASNDIPRKRYDSIEITIKSRLAAAILLDAPFWFTDVAW